MKLILHCSSSLNHSSGADYALVDLDEALAELAFRRMVQVQVMKRGDDQMYEARFWDYSPVWFSAYCQDGTEEESAALELLVEDIDPGAYKVVPEETVIHEAFHARTECNFMEVQDDEINWQCYIKHCDITITSAAIPVNVIREALKGTEVKA